jgi:hypothetical protein
MKSYSIILRRRVESVDAECRERVEIHRFMIPTFAILNPLSLA